MAVNDDETYLLNQQVSFIQHFLPGLDAGGYQLKVRQNIIDNAGNAVSGADYSNSYTFAVTADRFAISQPGNVISSVFPSDNVSGEFSNVLPHVVFSQKTFPWVRYPTNKLPYSPPEAGTDTDADVPTWLWVMLLDEDDIDACTAEGVSLSLTAATRCVADLFPQAALPSGTNSSLGSNYSYFNGATNILGLEPGETLTDAIQTIDVPLSLFWKIAPSVDDLKQMAHGRVVSLINQPTTTNTPDPGEPTGSFSIVFGNRLPATGKKTVAFLVSLEELENFLPSTSSGGAPAGNTYNGNLSLRLAVLSTWTFFSTGQPATFVHQLLSLNDRVIDDPKKQPPPAATNTNLRLPYQGSNAVVRGALNMGYVPLNETLRTSGQTVSWYRGPLTPYQVTQSWLQVPIASPDAATIFDPTTGLLDTSYAAAWTIGRMVALQDTSFSTAYYTWKRDLEMQVQQSVEDQMLEQSLGASLDLAPQAKQMKLMVGAPAPHGSNSLLKRTIMSLNPEA
ncbi:hypothetical protein [Undibacterium sp. TC9W]|uniref:hypothetical protein n=1 Tax=Undibacterium sp. TC9W TaxID=3413053 RepID=UPI003BF439AB